MSAAHVTCCASYGNRGEGASGRVNCYLSHESAKVYHYLSFSFDKVLNLKIFINQPAATTVRGTPTIVSKVNYMYGRSHFFSRFFTSIFAITMIFTGLNIIMPIPDYKVISIADGVITPSGPIVIEGNYDLSTHPSVRSGSGTNLDPYIISDFLIDTTASGRSGMAIRNTTSHLKIRNLTINVSQSATGIILYAFYSSGWNAMNIILENITINGGATQIDMYVPKSISIVDCTFNNPSSTGDAIFTRYGNYVNIFNNTFNCPNMDVDLDYTSYVTFTYNLGTFRRYDHLYFRNSDFANNSLDVYSARFFSGYFSDIQGNDLHGRMTDKNLVYLYDCNRIKIANNSLNGGYDTVYISHPNSYSPVRTDYPKWASLRFEYNTISKSNNRGIYFAWATGHPSIRYVNILYNRFTNCSSFAVSVRAGGHSSTVIWHNIFENNHGSKDVFQIPTAQAEDRYGQFSWNNRKMGNYWKDMRIPDENSDGYVDESQYPIFSSRNPVDHLPISNPYFDFEPPELKIFRPRGRFLDRSYINLSWEVSDNKSGLKKIEVRYGFNPWIDATGRDHHGFYLAQGSYQIKIRVTDKALLKTERTLDIMVNRTTLPLNVASPLDGAYYNHSNIDISWTIEDGFVPLNLSYILDGGPAINFDPWTNFQLPLPDGEHSLELRFHDHYGNEITKISNFIVDTTKPVIKIIYPAKGSVISNALVNFRWEQSDEFGISTMYFRIDDNEMEEIEQNFFSELLANGPHVLKVLAIDNAGNSNEESLEFVISKNTSLNIIAPRFETPVTARSLTLKWEYLYAGLEIESLSIVINNEPPLEISPLLQQYDITLPYDGKYRLTVRAFDSAGNVVSDTVEVILDREAPSPDFQFPSDGDFLNQTNLDLKWNAVEKWGIDHYDLYADDVLKAKNLKQGAFSLDLDQGVHVLKIVTYDLAGNIGAKLINITIDTQGPVLNLYEPFGDIFKDSYLSFSWEAVDDHGIDHYTYSMDGKPLEEVGLAASRQISMKEGFHIFILNCYDLAGNVGTIVKEFMVDLNDPEVFFTRAPSSHIRMFNGLIEWEIIESVGILTITLNIDGIEYQMSAGSRYFVIDLEDGSHSIFIIVTDLCGRSDSAIIDFAIDPNPPAMRKGAKDVTVDGSKALIFWVLEEEKENLTTILTLDGELINIDINLDDQFFLFGELDPGNHSVVLNLRDQAGNKKEIEWFFIIEENGGKNSISSSRNTGLFIALILIAMIIIGIVGYLYTRNRPREEEKRIEIPRKPSKLVIGPRPGPHSRIGPHDHQQIRHSHLSIKVPPSPFVTKGQKVGHGYIRPDQSAKQVKRTIIDTTPSKDHSSRTKDRTSEQPKIINQIEEWGEGEEIENWDSLEEL